MTDATDCYKLNQRDADDPMRLYTDVLNHLDRRFSAYNLAYIPGQRNLLAQAAEAILSAKPGTVMAIPFQPGMGKSTLIRALLDVFAVEFASDTDVAQRIGGVIIVVEKTSDADALEQLCNERATGPPVAKAISSVNEYNLSHGKCLNGTAATYKECPKRGCPDYAVCPLMRAASKIHETPILIITHARYQVHMENMEQFLTWNTRDGQERRRTLLLVDELPPLIEDNTLNLGILNQMESEFATFRPSYQTQFRKEKAHLLYQWNRIIRTPFFKLLAILRKCAGIYGIVTLEDFKDAGFAAEELQALEECISKYLNRTEGDALRLIDALLSNESAYYAVGQDVSVFFPRIRRLDGEQQPATFLFSGTAMLSPELSDNPHIISFPDQNLESFRQLHIYVQRGDAFNSSKTGLGKKQNLASLVAWLDAVLPEISQHNQKVLVVTYKQYADVLWNALQSWHALLLPYIGSDGQPQQRLPYFGGMNGSNLYQESTCVICLGLNRFEPKDYISRALALDFDGRCHADIERVFQEDKYLRLDTLPSVMDMQDITLARDIVQLVFRSQLRKHGDTQPIELWLLQPPNGTIAYLKSYFGDCQIEEINELPETCLIARTSGKTYLGNETHASRLMEYIQNVDVSTPITPEDIRRQTGLTKEQYKEAKKNRDVKSYFAKHFETKGSGINTVYYKER